MEHFAENSDAVDVRHVVCNLTPTILGHLDLAIQEGRDRVSFLIRQGIQLEMRSAFGTLERWHLEIDTLIGHDAMHFKRRSERPEADKPDLHLLDY